MSDRPWTIYSVLPSPYQRDFFNALAQKRLIQVYYLTGSASDSPWPEKELASWEQVLPGLSLNAGRFRLKFNHSLPEARANHYHLVNLDLTSPTTQYLMRWHLRHVPWIFWGEKLRYQSPPIKRFAQQLLTSPLKNATGIAHIGQWARESYTSRFPHTPVSSIPYACDLEPYQRVYSKNQDPSVTRFLFCGQMIHRKGFDLLLTAFDRLVRSVDSPSLVELHLVGRKDETHFLNTLTQTTRDQIKLTGFVNPDNLPEVFAGKHVFVLPSRHDGWAVVVNQAMAAGLPLILSEDTGASHDAIHHSDTGIKVKTNEVESLFQAMQTLVSSPELRTKMSQASFQKSQSFDPAVRVNELIQFAKSLNL